jgi:multiple sugar transport system permease protein/putative aldouronate transport system permease protein
VEVGEKNLSKRDRKRIVLATTPDGKTIKINSKSARHKYSGKDIVFYIFDYSFFIIFTISCIFPFYYLFINTISDAKLVSSGSINFIPRGINIQNYLALRNATDLGNAVLVSVTRTIFGTAIMVIASAFVGYLVTKKEMWGRKFFYRFLVITMYFNAGLIPWYLNMQMLGLTNSFAAYIIPGIVAPYNIILVKTYIESIPAELEESAFIDGASFMQVFRKIVWPLSKPILATIAIFGAVGNWNSFQDSLILMSDSPNLYTLQHRLYIYLTTSNNLGAVMNKGGSGSNAALDYANNGMLIKYTVSMVSVIPILLVYPFMQRYFEEGIMLGAVKG